VCYIDFLFISSAFFGFSRPFSFIPFTPPHIKIHSKMPFIFCWQKSAKTGFSILKKTRVSPVINSQKKSLETAS